MKESKDNLKILKERLTAIKDETLNYNINEMSLLINFCSRHFLEIFFVSNLVKPPETRMRKIPS